jgi:hypothetical protein
VQVTGTLSGRNWIWEGDVTLRKRYRVHLIRESATTTPPVRSLSTTMLSTTRNLNVCFVSRANCPEPPDEQVFPGLRPQFVQEHHVQITSLQNPLGSFGGTAPELLRNIQTALVTAKSDGQFAPPPIDFADTAYFQKNVLKDVGQPHLDTKIQEIPTLPSKFMESERLRGESAGTILGQSIAALAESLDASIADVLELRRFLVRHLSDIARRGR